MYEVRKGWKWSRAQAEAKVEAKLEEPKDEHDQKIEKK